MSEIFNTSFIRQVLISAIPALIAITVHELSHGFAAYSLGDDTAKKMGRLTLNPIRHIDIIGLIMILSIGFGWAKPVPVDMMKFKHPKRGMALTALCGPLSNILLAFFAALIFMALPEPYGGRYASIYALSPFRYELPVITLMLHRLIFINIFLAVFNILPIPPLDGSKVVFSVLPDKAYMKLMYYERIGMIVLIFFAFSGNIFGFDLFYNLVQRPAMALLDGVLEFAYAVTAIF